MSDRSRLLQKCWATQWVEQSSILYNNWIKPSLRNTAIDSLTINWKYCCVSTLWYPQSMHHINRANLWALVLLSTLVPHVDPVVIDEESDLPIKRLNAGQAMRIGVPIEMALERIRSAPHRRNALIRSLGATSLTQRAGRNLIFRVFLTIGKWCLQCSCD